MILPMRARGWSRRSIRTRMVSPADTSGGSSMVMVGRDGDEQGPSRTDRDSDGADGSDESDVDGVDGVDVVDFMEP